MKRALLLTLALLAASCTGLSNANHDMHDQSGHFSPDQLNWQGGPPSLPPGAQFVVLEGDPSKPGIFTMRVRTPDGYRIPPHTHPQVERVTVLSGTLHLGMNDRIDINSEKTLPAGSYVFMPPGMRHYAWTQGATEIQMTGMGPWAINYLNAADDPRNKK